MKVETVNQYEMTIEVGTEKKDFLYRTKKNLEELKESKEFEGFDGLQDSAEWTTKDNIECVKARAMNANGDSNIVRTFNKRNSKLGTTGYYTLEELKKYDLVYVYGYGIVEDFEAFEEAYNKAK